MESLTKKALEVREWPDIKKIESFAKFEVINMKTYKCRNKQNISPVCNLDFEPSMVKIDLKEIYQARIKAINAVQNYMNDIQNVSTQWLIDKSHSVLESLTKNESNQLVKG